MIREETTGARGASQSVTKASGGAGRGKVARKARGWPVAGEKSRLAVAALLCWQRASQIDERAAVRRATAGRRARQGAAGLSREAVNAVAAGRLDPGGLFTHTYRLDQLAEALDATRDRPDGFLKALVTFP